MMRACVLAAACGLMGVAPAMADEVILKNDTFVAGGTVAICPCFTPGEEAAVWLTVPCNGSIVGFQIFWKSFLGGALPVAEESIRVYSGGTFPVPGSLRDELLAPLLQDGGLNEYRFVDENQTIPIDIPVTAGETIVVSLQFFSDVTADPFNSPSVVSDGNGCQAGKNAVRVNGSTWASACSLGVTGDWVIRAIVDCSVAATGAACLPDGTCAEGLTEAEANALGAQWRGAGSTCATVSCVGACFVPASGACLQFDKPTCDLVAGQWQGPGTTSCDEPCPADLNGDGILDFGDVSAFVTAFTAGSLTADLNDDGVLDFGDVSEFVTLFAAGC